MSDTSFVNIKYGLFYLYVFYNAYKISCYMFYKVTANTKLTTAEP